MASLADISGNEAALSRQREILLRPLTEERVMANAIRALAIDAVEAAKCGHPGHADGHGRRGHELMEEIPQI